MVKTAGRGSPRTRGVAVAAVPADVAQEAVAVVPSVPVLAEGDALAALLAQVAAGAVPPPPECTPCAGDKTPAFVAWFRTHAGEAAFAQRYAGRVLGA